MRILYDSVKSCLTRCNHHVRTPKRFSSTQEYSRSPNSLSYGDWDPVIGLEIHAQINSRTKLFSSASTAYNSPPNTNVSLFDASIPGTLPVLNKKCVEAAILTGLSLNCTIQPKTSFDRKHYFYPDLPAGYQITQYRHPIATDGFMEFVVYNKYIHGAPYHKKSIIKQIQLEQDSGKSFHDEANSRTLIDLNRAGIGLMEIVFEPDLSDGEEASCLVQDLILILKSINTCNCKMEEGSLRVDANVSVRRLGESKLGTRTELKNLNSLRSVSKGIDYEIRRQIKILESNGTVINETRMYDMSKQQTLGMRDKEVIQDYRFMPEPNLPPLVFKDSLYNINIHRKNCLDINEYRKQMKKSPKDLRQEIMDKYKIPLDVAYFLMHEDELKQVFEDIMQENLNRNGSILYEFLTTVLQNVLKQNKQKLTESNLSRETLGQVTDLLSDDTISFGTASDILSLISRGENSMSPKEMVLKYEWYKIKSPDEIEKHCKEVIESLPKRAKSYHLKGSKFALHVMVSVVQKKTQNRINEEAVIEMLQKLLNPPLEKLIEKDEDDSKE